ncbi:uncharacterized protein Z520_06360 [Fonsecaea multimorphosa CBS 102226]|uniref:chitinase n=1 Tax=Fonsecaea multimorphosa CBS 102226 TaxID=1442371 RepID=A0A0D2KLM2_9EURO|nr:uncharacterized protein Z520_06360 [Fonsecaea multimorphosa CBS 102226]KIX97583.1 hypothetical protein Z520_06360 [Fonsecaea multimorphosa CBS 102226]
MYSTLASSVLTTLTLYSLISAVSAQTYSSCNPLQQSGCPADPALSKTVDIDFTAGSSNDFTASGAVSYTSDGAAFTISQHGDAPTISSNWYIMFGHVDYVVKAAPGTGIVSAAILQSDCLDEIDWEWIGGDDTQAQSNYFGKGITTTGYNRGAFHGAPNNHDEFHTYSIDWTADQIVWSIDGTTVRAMTQDQAEAGQYPQTPMYIKLGAWAGGDPSNPEGTIQWAGGVTDYSAGPFTMYVKSVHVTDYSTGSQYSYSGTSGTWQSIVSTGGQINGQGDGTPASSVSAPAVTSSVPNSAPLAFGNGGDTSSVYATRTGWPWSGTATATAVSVSTSPSLYTSSSVVLSLASASASLEISTSYNEQGFPTLVTINPAAPTTPVSYDTCDGTGIISHSRNRIRIGELCICCSFDLGFRTIRKPELCSFRSTEPKCYDEHEHIDRSVYLDTPQFDLHLGIGVCVHLGVCHSVYNNYFRRNRVSKYIRNRFLIRHKQHRFHFNN